MSRARRASAIRGPIVWLAALVLVLVGCSKPDDVLSLRQWTFTGPEGASHPVTIPVHVDTELPRAPSIFTLRTRVDLPPSYRGRPLTLAIPFWQAHIVARFDGVVARELDPESPDTYRTLGPARWEVAAVDADHVDVELRVASTWTQAGWIDSAPRLSATLDGDATWLWWRQFHATTDLGSFVTILLVGLSYAVIFLSGRARRASGWFAIEALVGAGYPAFELGYLERVFGTADVSAIGVMLSVATVANVHFVHAHCKLPTPTRLWWVGLAAVVVASVAFAGPFSATRIVAPMTVLFMLVNAVHQTRVFGQIVRAPDRRLHPWIVPLSWPLACLLSMGDFGGWVGLGGVVGELRGASLGIGFISLLQSIALSREYTLALTHADFLNRELAQQVEALQATNREIGHLNEDLRRHIATHSQSLVEALAQAASGETIQRDALKPGVVVSDRYRIVRELGHGGMGAVFEVVRVRDDRHFALKALAHAAAGDALVRLAREAEVASHIDHPNVVGVVDVDVTATGLLYLVMELVEGKSLEQCSAQWGDVAWAKGVLAQVAAGVAAIHARGVVHRDLKPSNLLLESATGRVKIADFGISSLGLGAGETELHTPPVDAAFAATQRSGDTPSDAARSDRGARSGALTKTGVVMGTPLYMAPELLRGARSAPPSADVFSLGIIAHELLTGEHPFGEAPITYTLRANRPPVPPIERDGVSDELARIIHLCVSFDPEARPSGKELADALAEGDEHAARVYA
jgi:tRNA A-37 threonylcarbamoyl transferase component Bud32